VPSATPAITATATVAPGATATPAETVKPAGVPTVTPLSVDAIGWLRILVAFVMPLALLIFILKLIHDRSFQSATGMLYLVVVLTLAGEAMARGLFLIGLQ
jgi:DMSO reductase anchor subunit